MRIKNTLYASFFLLCLFLLSGCSSEPVETDLLLPVRFSSLPSHLALSPPFTKQVTVRIRGSAGQIERIKQENPGYPVDLYTDLAYDPAGGRVLIEPETYLIPVIEKRIPMPRGIEVVKTTPSHIVVCLEAKIRKTVDVKVPIEGKPASGYTVLPAKPDPAEITITGAKSAIEDITGLETEAIALNGAAESFRKKVPVNMDDTSVSATPQIITVSVDVKKKRVVRTFKNIPVALVNTPFKCSLSPAAITIGVKGPYDAVHKKDIKQKITAYIDLDGVKPGVYVRKAVIELPVGLIMTKAEPEIFTVKIK